jgi:hypothetical protein
VAYTDHNGQADSNITATRTLSGRLNANHKNAILEGSSRLLSGDRWIRSCQLQVSFDSDPLGAYASTYFGSDKKTLKIASSGAGATGHTTDPKVIAHSNDGAPQREDADKLSEIEKGRKDAEAELAALRARIVSTEKTGGLAKISQLNAEADILRIKLDGYRDLEEQLRSAFEAKTESSITDLKSKLKALVEDPTTKNNTSAITAIKGQIEALQAKSLLDDPIYASLAAKITGLEGAVTDGETAIRTELDANQKQNDTQRDKDLHDIYSKFDHLNNDINANQQAMTAKMDAFKATTQTKLQMLSLDLDQLKARTSAVEKDQQALAMKQSELAQQQAKTEQDVKTARGILANILLPVSETPGDWMMRVSAVPIQQQQFCRIIDQFYDKLTNVYQFRNEIKKNALYRDRQQDLASLLPNGAINSWVVRVVEVTQASDGSAAVMLQPPCRAMLGSDACATNGRKMRATIPADSLMYRELSRVNAGDFVTISGTVLYAQAVDLDTPLPDYAVYEPKKHCSSADGAKDEDVFVTQLSTLAVLR